MALHIFTVFAEAPSDDRAFWAAQQNPLLAGRTRYEILDSSTMHPSDQAAFQRAEWMYGVQPQENQVDIAGPNTNTVRAIRVHTMNKGMKRLMFFGVRRGL